MRELNATDVEDALAKDKGKGKANSNNDWGSSVEEEETESRHTPATLLNVLP